MLFEKPFSKYSLSLMLLMALYSSWASAQYITETQRVERDTAAREATEDQYYKEMVGRTFWFQPSRYMRAAFYSSYSRSPSGEFNLPSKSKFFPESTVSFEVKEFVPNRTRYGRPEHIFKVEIEDGTMAFMQAKDFGSASMRSYQHMYLTEKAEAVIPALKEFNDKLLTKSPEEILAAYELSKREKALAEEAARRKQADDEEKQRIDHERTLASVKAAAQANKRKGGVRIGMSAKQVLNSSWGKPSDVNRTTTASGVTEQWVYGSSSYLYFTNGKLTAIQN